MIQSLSAEIRINNIKKISVKVSLYIINNNNSSLSSHCSLTSTCIGKWFGFQGCLLMFAGTCITEARLVHGGC